MTTILCSDPAVSVVLGDLTIPGDPGDEVLGTWWNQLILPDWSLRYVYAPPSAYVPGQVLLSAQQDVGALTMTVAVRGTSLTDLLDRQAALSLALAAWPGTVEIRADEGAGPVAIAGPWDSFPTVPQWGAVLPGKLRLLVSEATVSLPVNPPGAP